MSGAFALRTNELLALGGPADDVVNEVELEAEAGGSPSTGRMLALLSNSSAGYGGAGSA